MLLKEDLDTISTKFFLIHRENSFPDSGIQFLDALVLIQTDILNMDANMM